MKLSRAFQPPAAAPLAALVLFAAACSRADRLPKVEVEQLVHELLLPELFTVVREDAARPARLDLVKPRGSGSGDHGTYPALELAPPVEVLWKVPPSYPEAVLRFALCIASRGYHGSGAVRVELELDGQRVFSRSLPCGAELPPDERRWHQSELPIGAGGELRLRASYHGDQPSGPAIGLGLARVVVALEVERQRARPGAPNVLMIVIDTLRADRLHHHGNERPVSPTLDALAARGVAFERAYSSAAWTIPSTASLLTGASPPEHGLGVAENFYLAGSLVTLPEAFQNAGFTTGAFACNPLISAGHNFHQGFEHFQVYNWPHARLVYDDVAEWLRARGGERFFLYVHFVDPHYPYAPNEEARAGIVGEPPSDYVERRLDAFLEEFYDDPDADLAALRAATAHQLDLYDAELRGVDTVIGRLLALLDELGIGENTVVAVTSDHGEEFLEHGWAGHHSQLFDPQTRVPLILAGPGVPHGLRPDFPVENRFLAPTLLVLAGLGTPGNLAGPSLLELGSDGALAARGVYLTNNKGRWADLEARRVEQRPQIHSVIEDGWRFVWSPGEPAGGAGELSALYELARDPDCRHDLSARHPERVAHMRGLVQRWLAEGRDRRPRSMPAADATLEMLRGIGYLSDER